MVLTRLTYLLIYAAVGVFFVLSPGYFSFLLLAALTALPFLSLLLTLPALFRLRLTASCAVHAVPRGGSVLLRLTLTPGGAADRGIRLRWRFDSLLYPQLGKSGQTVLLRGDEVQLPLPTDHCGWVRFTVTRCALRDWLGLWSLPARVPPPVLVLVRPVEDYADLPNLEEPAAGQRLIPRPGGGMGEEYDLRDYRPGDPVNAIHWKLTAKRPPLRDPVLRETLEPLRPMPVLCYDHFGSPDDVDKALDRAAALAAQLLEKGRPFVLLGQGPHPSEDTVCPVACAADWERRLRALSAQAAPETGVSRSPLSLPGFSGPMRFLRLEAGEKEGRP